MSLIFEFFNCSPDDSLVEHSTHNSKTLVQIPPLIQGKIKCQKTYFLFICGLYYKHITIINDDSIIINMWDMSYTDDARVIIYNRNMFILQATDFFNETIETINKHELTNTVQSDSLQRKLSRLPFACSMCLGESDWHYSKTEICGWTPSQMNSCLQLVSSLTSLVNQLFRDILSWAQLKLWSHKVHASLIYSSCLGGSQITMNKNISS